jgi:hypothetical protein
MDIDGFILMQREARILSPHLTITFLFFSAKQKKGRVEKHPKRRITREVPGANTVPQEVKILPGTPPAHA